MPTATAPHPRAERLPGRWRSALRVREDRDQVERATHVYRQRYIWWGAYLMVGGSLSVLHATSGRPLGPLLAVFYGSWAVAHMAATVADMRRRPRGRLRTMK
jgi:hypothetical protein